MLARLKKLFKKKEVIVPVIVKLRVRPASVWGNQPRREVTQSPTADNFSPTDLLMTALIIDSLTDKPSEPQYSDFVGNGGNFSGAGASDSWSHDTNTNTSNDNYSSSDSSSSGSDSGSSGGD